jgi:hypothetical protein
MTIRTALSAIGVVLAALAFAMVLNPSLASTLTVSEVLLVVVGVLALVQGVRMVSSRIREPYQQLALPDPEQTQDLQTPGDDFDELLREAGTNRRNIESRQRVEARLDRAAVATIVRTQGCTAEEARRRLDDGDWTDDPYAAAFFTGAVSGGSFLSRVELFGSTRSQYHRWATHAAREIARLSEEFES